MAESLAAWFVSTFGGILSKQVIVFIVSLLPILELRGGILAGYAMNMPMIENFIIAYIGNILPIPFILYFIKFIFRILKNTPLKGFVLWCEQKALKNHALIEKYAHWGLLIFVAVPLPGTGAWTGALIASFFEIEPKKAFPVIMLGVLIAGIIVTMVSYGFLSAIGIG